MTKSKGILLATWAAVTVALLVYCFQGTEHEDFHKEKEQIAKLEKEIDSLNKDREGLKKNCGRKKLNKRTGKDSLTRSKIFP